MKEGAGKHAHSNWCRKSIRQNSKPFYDKNTQQTGIRTTFNIIKDMWKAQEEDKDAHSPVHFYLT